MYQNWFGLQRGKYIGEPPAYVDKLRALGHGMPTKLNKMI